VIILICSVCLSAKQYTTFKWKSVISVFPVFTRSCRYTNQARLEIIASFNCPLPTKYSCQKTIKIQWRIFELRLKISGSFLMSHSAFVIHQHRRTHTTRGDTQRRVSACVALRRRIRCERGLMSHSLTTSVCHIMTSQLRLAYLLIEFVNNNETYVYSTVIKRQTATLKTVVMFHWQFAFVVLLPRDAMHPRY